MRIFFISAGALWLAAMGAARAADLAVTIENVTSDRGHIMVGLFDAAASFPKKAAQGRAVDASRRDTNGKVRVVFPDLAPGRYAVSAYQDLDGNGKLDANVMGIPAQPYGFSGASAGRLGPPTFDEAAVELRAEGSSINVHIK